MKNLMLIISLLLTSFVSVSQNKSTTGDETQGTTTYVIQRHTISSGGGQMSDSSGVYKVLGVIGQIDAGHNATNSPYVFKGGFLHGATPTSSGDLIFKNGFE